MSQAGVVPIHSASAEAALGRREKAWRLSGVILAHSVVDFFSYIIIPILTVLEGRVHMRPEQGAILIALGSVSSGVIQPLVAIWSDKYDTRWFGTLGFLLAVLAIGLTGFATEYWHLLLIQIVGAMGVGAFHPVGAAAMGHLSAPRRSLGVAVFFAAGMVGGVLGSASTPQYVKAFGVEALWWLIPPGLFVAWMLKRATHDVAHMSRGAASAHRELPEGERRARWAAVWVLYIGNAIRFTVNMMLVQLFIRWSEHLVTAQGHALDEVGRTEASTLGGPLQAAMQVGMGVAGLGVGAVLKLKHERVALVVIPLAAAAAIGLFPIAGSRGLEILCAALAGVGFAGMLPVTIAMAQRLLPHRTSLASGLMMGGAWGVAAVGPPLAQFLLERFGLETTFWLTAALLAVGGVASLVLFHPRFRNGLGLPPA